MNPLVVDYGAGNLRSVAQALWRVGAEPEISADPQCVRRAERVVLPGVGAAGPALKRLRSAQLDCALNEARSAGCPIFGICLGMQFMAEELLEYGRHQGLGWIRGKVEILDAARYPSARVPHMGWNEIEPTGRATLMSCSKRQDRNFYFCHSYHLSGDDDIAVARVTHGATFTCAVQFDTVFATQFHPEKSHVAGQRLIERFLTWRP
jgi:imidazole glycerol-phosphate synthase subunit HisH